MPPVFATNLYVGRRRAPDTSQTARESLLECWIWLRRRVAKGEGEDGGGRRGEARRKRGDEVGDGVRALDVSRGKEGESGMVEGAPSYIYLAERFR